MSPRERFAGRQYANTYQPPAVTDVIQAPPGARTPEVRSRAAELVAPSRQQETQLTERFSRAKEKHPEVVWRLACPCGARGDKLPALERRDGMLGMLVPSSRLFDHAGGQAVRIPKRVLLSVKRSHRVSAQFACPKCSARYLFSTHRETEVERFAVEGDELFVFGDVAPEDWTWIPHSTFGFAQVTTPHA